MHDDVLLQRDESQVFDGGAQQDGVPEISPTTAQQNLSKSETMRTTSNVDNDKIIWQIKTKPSIDRHQRRRQPEFSFITIQKLSLRKNGELN